MFPNSNPRKTPMWDTIKRWLGIAQKETDEALQKGEEIIKAGFQKVDEAAHKAGDKIKDIMKPVDELGKKIGGTKGPTNGGADLK